MSPAQGSKLHSEGSAGTVSAWPSRHSVGPWALAAQAGDEVRAPGLGGEQLALEARVGRASRRAAPARAARCPGGLAVSMRISRWRSSTRLARRGRRPAGDRASSLHPSRLLRSRRARPGSGHTDRLENRVMERLFDTGEERGQRTSVPPAEAPLAVRMRPRSLDELVGQEHLLGEGSALRTAIESRRAALGDPLRAARARARRPWPGSSPRPRRGAFEEESAVNAGRAEVRAVIERAEERRRGRRRADDLLPRRDPPLQQGAAGRAAARGRGGAA